MSIFDTLKKSLESIKAGGVQQTKKIDAALETQLKNRGMVDIGGNVISDANKVKNILAERKAAETKANVKAATQSAPIQKFNATYYDPKAASQTKPVADGIGAFNKPVEFGDVAMGNRKYAEGTLIFVPELKDVKTPHGEGIFRVNDKKNIRFDGMQDSFDIAVPQDLKNASDLQKRIGNNQMSFQVVNNTGTAKVDPITGLIKDTTVLKPGPTVMSAILAKTAPTEKVTYGTENKLSPFAVATMSTKNYNPQTLEQYQKITPVDKTIGETFVSGITAPIRYTAGSLAKFAVSSALEKTNSDLEYIPKKQWEELLIGPEIVKKLSEDESLYGIGSRWTAEKLKNIGVPESIANKTGLAGAFVMGALIENPFVAGIGKGGKELLAKSMQETLEKEMGRKLAKEELQNITVKATELFNIADKAEREVVAQDFIKTFKEGTTAPASARNIVAQGEDASRLAQRTAQKETSQALPKLDTTKEDVLQAGKVDPEKNKFVESYTQDYYSTPEKSIDLKQSETELAPGNLNPEKVGFFKSFKQKAEDSFVKWSERINDDWASVKKLIENPDVKISESVTPYEKEILMHGKIGSQIEALDNMANKLDQDLLKTSRQLDIGDDVLRKDINDYMIAKHAPERNAKLGAKAAGITDEEALAIIKEIESKPYAAQVQKISQEIVDMNRNTLKILLDSQVIDQKTFDTLTTVYKNHVPLQRVFDEGEDMVDILASRGLDVRFSGIRAAKGSTLEVADVINNVLAAQKAAIVKAEKNIVDLSTLKMVRENKKVFGDLFQEMKPKAIGQTFDGRPIMEKIVDPKVLQMKENGKTVLLKINDPHLAAALKGINRVKVTDIITKSIQTFNRFYSGLMTRFNPEFAFPNKLRDLQESLIFAASKKELGAKGAGKTLMKELSLKSERDVLDAIRGIDSEGARLYRQMQKDGGTTGGMGLSTRKQLDINFAEMQKINRSAPRKAAQKVVEAIDNWNTLFEDSTRLSVYRTALEQGATREKAAVLAKEASINFNKMGTAGPVLNALYMFSNASIQGSVKMMRAMKNPKVAAAVTTAVVASVAAVNEFNDRMDPQWREKVTKWDRMANLTIVVKKPGFANADKEDFWYVNIPVSWGLKPIKVMSDALLDAASGEKVDLKDSMADIAASAINAYNPVGGTDLFSAVLPSILDTPADIARNLSWSGGKIRPDWDKNAPASIQYFSDLKDSTTGKLFAYVTEKLSEKGIEISPANIDYAYQQYVGGTGRFASKIINTIGSIGKGELPPVKEIPFISRFLRQRGTEVLGSENKEADKIKETLQTRSKENFRIKEDAEELWKAYTIMPEGQRKEEFKRLEAANPKLADKVKDVAKDDKAGVTYIERTIKSLGVENGDRSKYITNAMKAMPTEERKAYYKNLVDKGVITEEVKRQIQIRWTKEKSQ